MAAALPARSTRRCCCAPTGADGAPAPQRWRESSRWRRSATTSRTSWHSGVWPPLRRWAASRVLVSRLAEPDALIEHARRLPAHDGAAVITGAVDAADHLPPRQARAVVDIAIGWGHKSPRKAALERLCSWGETERAHAAAATDPDASLRRWGANLGHDAQAGIFD